MPNKNSAPFVELYNESIIDFKSLGNNWTANKNDTEKGSPNSKVIDNNDVVLSFDYIRVHNDFSGTQTHILILKLEQIILVL